jgi:hypothetical protein
VAKEVCVELDEKLYEEIQRVRGRGLSLVDIIKAGLEKLVSTESKLLEYTECGRQAPFSYMWPSGEEVFDEALCFNVNGDIYYVAYGSREAFGSNRRRVIVFRRSRRGKTLSALVEFAGTDNWNETKLVASFIKKPDDKYARIGEAEKLPGYNVLKDCIKEHSSVIKDGKKGLAALVVREDDHEKILYHAVQRYKYKSSSGKSTPIMK